MIFIEKELSENGVFFRAVLANHMVVLRSFNFVVLHGLAKTLLRSSGPALVSHAFSLEHPFLNRCSSTRPLCANVERTVFQQTHSRKSYSCRFSCGYHNNKTKESGDS